MAESLSRIILTHSAASSFDMYQDSKYDLISSSVTTSPRASNLVSDICEGRIFPNSGRYFLKSAELTCHLFINSCTSLILRAHVFIYQTICEFLSLWNLPSVSHSFRDSRNSLSSWKSISCHILKYPYEYLSTGFAPANGFPLSSSESTGYIPYSHDADFTSLYHARKAAFSK